MNFRLPKAFQQSEQSTPTQVTAKHSVTAGGVVETNLDMSDDVAGNGLCPDCKKPMEQVVIEDENCWTCLPCRVALPMRDPEHAVDIGEPVQPEPEAQAAPTDTTETEQPDENNDSA